MNSLLRCHLVCLYQAQSCWIPRGCHVHLLILTILALWIKDSLSLPLLDILEPVTSHKVPHMVKYFINNDTLWADYTCDTSVCMETCTIHLGSLSRHYLFLHNSITDAQAYLRIVHQFPLIGFGNYGLYWQGQSTVIHHLLKWCCTNKLLPLQNMVSSNDTSSWCHYPRSSKLNKTTVEVSIFSSPWRMCSEMSYHYQQVF